MKTVKLIDLHPQDNLSTFVCHSSGAILHKPGEALTLPQISLMQDCEITEVTILDENEDPEEFRRTQRRRPVPIEDIDAAPQCPVTLIDDDNKPVVKEGCSIEESLLSSLKSKGIQCLYYERLPEELGELQCERYYAMLDNDVDETLECIREVKHPAEIVAEAEAARTRQAAEEALANLHIPAKRMFDSPSLQASENALRKMVGDASIMRTTPQGDPLKGFVKRTTGERSEEEKAARNKRYLSWVSFMEKAYANLRQGRRLDFDEVEQTARDIVFGFIEDSFYILNLTNTKHPTNSDKYLAGHSTDIAILSVAIADVLGYSMIQAMEIVCAALLHDIGHAATPHNIVEKAISGNLDKAAQQKFAGHPVAGLALVRNMQRIPLSVVFAAYQHHETLDGIGYPSRTESKALHDYAKLVAVTNEFAKLKQATSPNKALLSVAASAKAGHLDMRFVNGLIASVSLYPIGSLILLDPNQIGKVVGFSGKDIKRPIVRVVYEVKDNKVEVAQMAFMIDLAANPDITITKEIPSFKGDITQGF